MAYRIKLDGTTRDQFQVGLNGVTLDVSAVSAPWSWVFPAGPGSAGYVLQTDGAGNLSWAAVGAASDSTVPYFIPAATTYTVNEYKQALFATSIDVEGTLEVNGLLVEVS
jgi:hypothetical protein